MEDLGVFWRGRWWKLAGGEGNPSSGDGSGGGTGDGTGGGGGNPGSENTGEQERRFTQADMDRVVEERLRRDRETNERRAAAERQQAADAAAAEQGEFRQLAEQRATRIAELEPFEAQARRYSEALGTLLTVQREGLQPHIIELLDRLDPADQLEWIAAHQAELRPAEGEQKESRGPGPTPRKTGEETREQRVDALYNRMKSGARR